MKISTRTIRIWSPAITWYAARRVLGSDEKHHCLADVIIHVNLSQLPTSKDTREFLEKLAPLPNYAHTLAALRTAAVPPSPLLEASAAPPQEPACEDSQTLTSEGESGEGETKENRADDSDSADSDDSDQQSLATRPPRPLSRTCRV